MSNLILIIDPGHGGKDPGGGNNQYWHEKDFTLQISQYQYKRFKELGVAVALTRNQDTTLEANDRSKMVKDSGAKYCISNHINSGGGEGAETIYSIYNDGKLANKILNELVNAGQKKRRAFTRSLISSPNKDYYYMHRQTGAVTTIIVEYGFADNANDTIRLQQHWKEYAEAVVKAFCEYAGIGYLKEEETSIPGDSKVSIQGESKATAAQMKKYLLKVNVNPKINCSADDLIRYYMEEGRDEGVRGDIAFAQALKETGHFKYGGIVLPEQNNFAGLGALNNNAEGQAATFSTPRIGVRAQIQHLKGYATTQRPKNDIVDPRYEILVGAKLLGTAPYVTDLNGKWAVPGETYGQEILKILDKILDVTTDEVNCEEVTAEMNKEIDRLTQENLILKDKIKKISEIIL